MISRVVEIGGGGDKRLTANREPDQAPWTENGSKATRFGGHGYLRETVINDVEPFLKKTKKKEGGGRYFRRIGSKLVLGRKQKLDVGG